MGSIPTFIFGVIPLPHPLRQVPFLWIGSLVSNFHIEYGSLRAKYVPVEYSILYINVFF